MYIAPLPDALKGSLRLVLSLDDNQIDELVKLYENSKPALSAKEYADRISDNVKSLPASDAYRITRGLLAFYQVKIGRDLSGFIDQVSSATGEDDTPVFGEGEREVFKHNIEPLLSLHNSLEITAKSNNVYAEHDHVFCSARIMTDMRPVFDESDDFNLSAVGIVHTIKIEYHRNGDHNSFFVAMDHSDLKEMQKLLNREEQKTAKLVGSLSKWDIEVLGE